MAMRELMYREALREALDEEMARDPTVFVIGEGIAERGGSYKVTEGLLAPKVVDAVTVKLKLKWKTYDSRRQGFLFNKFFIWR